MGFTSFSSGCFTIAANTGNRQKTGKFHIFSVLHDKFYVFQMTLFAYNSQIFVLQHIIFLKFVL